MGVSVTIHGTNFKGLGFEQGPSSVHLGPTNGPTNVTNLVVVSETIMTCTLPDRQEGWPQKVDLWVTTPLGGGRRFGAFKFFEPEALTVTSLSPASGNFRGGTALTLLGTGFLDVAAVFFDLFGELVPWNSFVINSHTQISGVAPSGTAFAPYGVRVRRTNGEEVRFKCGSPTIFAWTYDPDPHPSFVNPLEPNHGSWSGGITVIGRGTGFVSIGVDSIQYEALVLATSATIDETTLSITTFTPAAADAAGNSANPYDFVGGAVTYWGYAAGGPVSAYDYTIDYLAILEATPSSAPVSGGKTITIRGTSLDTLSAIKVVDDVNSATYDCTASMVIIDTEHASFTFPAMAANAAGRITIVGTDIGFGSTAGHAEGDGNAIWTGYEHLWTLNFEFTPGQPPQEPISLNVVTGPAAGGTTVTVQVVDSSVVTDLKFGGVSVGGSFVVVDGTHVRGDTPPHAAGVVSVNTANIYGISSPLPNAYTYV